MKNIIAITTTFNNRTLVVTEFSKRIDGKFTVILDEDINQAHDFKTKEEAKPVLIRIFNPFDRHYVIEPLEVEETARIYNEEQKIA